MKGFRIKKYLKYVYGIAILLFILNKFYLRPWVLKNDVPDFFIVATNSLPNLMEAIIGTIVITAILLHFRLFLNKKSGGSKTNIYILAVFLAAAYVITQEVKLHNLGGNNVYDPNDLIASLIGLSGTFLMIQLLGFTDSNN